MKLFVVALLLFSQTPPPMPRGAPQSTADTPQKQTQTEQGPPNSPPLGNGQIQAKPANPHDENDQKCKDNHKIEIVEFPTAPSKKDGVDWPIWIFNSALVVVGFLQWWVLRRQAKIAHNQEFQMVEAGKQTKVIIDQMKDTAVRDLRAYVGISNIFLNLSNPALPIANVEIQNFGRTPAYKVKQWVGIAPNDFPLTVELPKSSYIEDGSSSVISPGIRQSSAVPLKKALPPGIVAGVGVTLYVYGEVIYEDVFETPRHVKFRFFYGGSEKLTNIRKEGALLGVMNPDSNGNEAD